MGSPNQHGGPGEGATKDGCKGHDPVRAVNGGKQRAHGAASPSGSCNAAARCDSHRGHTQNRCHNLTSQAPTNRRDKENCQSTWPQRPQW